MRNATTKIFLFVWMLIPLLLLCNARTGMAQQTFKLLSKMECQATMVRADNLGRIYTLQGSTLGCYDSIMTLVSTYSDLRNGTFTSVDVSDPLKIVLFSGDFSTLTFLDQRLAEQGSPIELQSLGVSNVTLACNSYESGFWVYDAALIQLIRFDNQSLQAQNSDNISALCGAEVHPNFLAEINNMVYLCDTAVGILLFDRYGGYLKTLPFKGVQNLQAAGDHLIFCTDKELMAYHTIDHTIAAMPLPAKAVSAYSWHDKLFLLTGNNLEVYRML